MTFAEFRGGTAADRWARAAAAVGQQALTCCPQEGERDTMLTQALAERPELLLRRAAPATGRPVPVPPDHRSCSLRLPVSSSSRRPVW